MYLIRGVCNSEAGTDAVVYVLYYPGHLQPETHMLRKLTIFCP